MNYLFRTMILPASIAETARNMAVSIIGESVANLWTVPLCNAANAITHYISTGMIAEDFVELVSDPAILSEKAGISLEQAQAILARADITKESPETAMARLGLFNYNPDVVDASAGNR